MSYPSDRNNLAQATSPYLLQHKDNPVHWQQWGSEAFAEARRRNVPVLLSIGYAACHWCHVMAHESFADDEVAALMNKHYVCIKLDREERPDIDDIYMTALAMMGEAGGWPLTMVLDQDGRAFWGGTYFSKLPQNGRPGFMQILEQLARLYHEDAPRIEQNARALYEGMKARAANRPDANDAMAKNLSSRAATALAAHFDAGGGLGGGDGGAPKFPQPFLYNFIRQQAQFNNDASLLKAVKNAVRQMCRGGLFDHIGGGFARYSVDAYWRVPHFEKMLYDNAQLIGLLTQLYRTDQNPFWQHFISLSIDWLKTEMLLENGGFAASLDADSMDASGAMCEGAFYVWTPEEIEKILGADEATDFCAHYDITPAGNFAAPSGDMTQNKSIANLLNSAPTHFEFMPTARQKLYRARQQRAAPARDDKMLADWNALTITSLAEAAQIFERPDWLALAENAFAAIINNLQRDDGLLAHASRQGQRLDIALAADHGCMIEAACALYQASGKIIYLTHGENWAEKLDAAFGEKERGGYFVGEPQLADIGTAHLLVRNQPVHDNAQPSTNAAILAGLASLATASGNPVWRAQGEKLFTALAGHLATQYTSMTALLAAHHKLQHNLSVIIIADENDKQGDQLYRAITSRPYDGVALVRHPAGTATPKDLPRFHPAYGKRPIEGKATAYICTAQHCLPPITSASELINRLDARLTKEQNSQTL